MAYDIPDVYYQPEKFGLTPVAEIDYSDGNYQFDIRVVWKHKDGKLYTGRDSGCSCPSPFELVTQLDHLDELDIDVLQAEVYDELNEENTYFGPNISAIEAERFLHLVREAMED